MNIPQGSNWLLPQTPKQGSSIAKLAQILGIREYIEDVPTTRYEARGLIYSLLRRTRESHKHRKVSSQRPN